MNKLDYVKTVDQIVFTMQWTTFSLGMMPDLVGIETAEEMLSISEINLKTWNPRFKTGV